MAQPRASQTAFHVSLEAPRFMPSGFSFSFGPAEVKSSVPRPLATSPSSLSSSSPRSSLYLAVRVRSLVSLFRKRVKRRSQTTRKKKSDDARFCRDIEVEAYREIDRYLGKPKRSPTGRLRTREGTKKEEGTADAPGFYNQSLSCGVNVNRSLRLIENNADISTHSLTRLAANNLFLSRKADFTVRCLSSKELQKLIINVRDLRETLRLAASSGSNALSHPPTRNAERSSGLSYIANLEHLLLCLQSQLLRQLVQRCVDLVRGHILECQKTLERSCKDWSSEYPDSRRPLSTTWPWSIRPSLAVLWGVCWMFFGPLYWDNEGLLTDQEGSIRISCRELEQLFSISNVQQATQRGAPQPSISRVNNSVVSQMLYAQARLPPSTGGSAHLLRRVDPSPSRSSASDFPGAQPQHHMSRPFNSWSRGHNNAYSASSESWQTPFCLSYSEAPEANSEADGQHHQAPASFAALANLAANSHNTAYPAPNQGDAPPPGAWLPDAPQEPNFPLPSNGNSAYLSDQNWWQEQQQPPHHATQRRRQYPQPAHTPGNLIVQTDSLPPRPRSTPTIRVITDQLEPQAQPQDSHHTSATSLHTPYSYDSTPYIDQNNLYPLHQNFDGMADVEVQGPPPPPQVSQIGPNNNGIVSPISDHPAISRPMSPSNQQMVDPSIRKRSFSEMSQGQPPMQMIAPEHHQSPQASVAYETSPGGLEDHGHKVQRSIKRGDPPQAHDGKYYCSFAPECADQYFDRKCEWSKHMDKHDRPYRCPQPQCAKLQGFTYSGGLLRHEREVHGKHGGPKEQLRCTVPECKRHSGKGFTRKENLNEHLRRVHGITTSTTTDASQLRQIAVDAAPGADLMETPASRFSETGEVDEFNAATPAYPDLVKRRRLDAGGSPHNGPDDLELELQRLKADNLEKDERIRRMEENDAAREARMKSLEDKLAQLTNQGMQRVPEQANMGMYPDFDGSVEVMQQVQEP